MTIRRRPPQDPIVQIIEAAWPANAAALADLQELTVWNPNLAEGFRTALHRATASERQREARLHLGRVGRARPAKVTLADGILSFWPKGRRHRP